MKSVTIRELHMNTGRVVRASVHGNILVTERGQPVAVLKSAKAADLIGKPFPERDLRKMPRVPGDSTTYISEERDAR
jgi:prevent-host-death family protein